MPTNKERSGTAAVAVDLVAKVNGDPNEAPATKCMDLLANLMHYADTNGFNFSVQINRARSNYDAEIKEEV